MKNKIVLLLIIFFAGSFKLSGQLFRNYTKLDITKNSVDGFSVGLGEGMTSFQNSTNFNSTENSIYKKNIDFVLDGNYSWHPLIFNVSLFSSDFRTRMNNSISNGYEVTIKLFFI